MKDDYLALCEEVTEKAHGIRRLRNRPIFSAALGSGRFVMTSCATVTNGLDDVFFMVREAETLAVISHGETQARAMEIARKVLEHFSPLDVSRYVERIRERRAREEAEERKRFAEAEAEIEAMRKQRAKVESIPRRRRLIFEESGGKCHYCETVLTLDGKWHIEHKMPKALGGSNEPSNLVASCVTCNMKKRDTTDVEFKARMKKEASQ